MGTAEKPRLRRPRNHNFILLLFAVAAAATEEEEKQMLAKRHCYFHNSEEAEEDLSAYIAEIAGIQQQNPINQKRPRFDSYMASVMVKIQSREPTESELVYLGRTQMNDKDRRLFYKYISAGKLAAAKAVAMKYPKLIRSQLANYVHQTSPRMWTTVHYAMQLGMLDMLQFLIDECGCTNFNQLNIDHQTPLITGVRYAKNFEAPQIQCVRWLLDRFPDPGQLNLTQADVAGWQLLDHCISRGCYSLIEKLVAERNCNCNYRDALGFSPIFRALQFSHAVSFKDLPENAEFFDRINHATRIVSFLIEHCENFNPKEFFGPHHETLLHAALKSESAIMVTYLIQKFKVSVHIPDARGITPIHLAALAQNRKLFILLTRLGADPDVKDGHDNTPLMFAVSSNAVDVVQHILSAHKGKVDLYAKNIDGISILEMAKAKQYYFPGSPVYQLIQDACSL